MTKELLEFYTGIRGFKVKEDSFIFLNQHEYYLKSGMYNAFKEFARMLNEKGWTPQNAGNISLRNQSGFTITASGSNFSNLEEDELCDVGMVSVRVGELHLPINTSCGISYNFDLHRVCSSLKLQGLLAQMQKDLGIEFDMPEDPVLEIWKAERGRELMRIHNISYAEIAGYEGRGKIADRLRLSEEDKAALDSAFVHENFSLNDILRQHTEIAVEQITQSGLTLHDVVEYLGKRQMIECCVHSCCLPGKKPSSETLLHGLIYANFGIGPDGINAICHCHAPNPINYPPKEIPVTKTSAKTAGYGTLELALEAVDALRLNYKGPFIEYPGGRRWPPRNHQAVIMRDHGPIVVTSVNEGTRKSLGELYLLLCSLNNISQPTIPKRIINYIIETGRRIKQAIS